MIEMMKFDMGGSASTLGAAAAIAQLKPKDVGRSTCELKVKELGHGKVEMLLISERYDKVAST
jgi:hypothetical protein